MKHFFLLFLTTLLSVSAWGAVSVPTTFGSYISMADAKTNGDLTLGNCSVDSSNDGYVIGSTHNNSTITFNVTNTTAGNYLLQFKSGANNLTATVKVEVTGIGYTKSADFNISNTGSWTPTELHIMDCPTMPTGSFTVKLTVISTTASYAGNYGWFALYQTSDYDQCDGTNIDLSKGTYNRARFQDPNVGYVDNGASAAYTVYNATTGTASLHMGIVRYGDGDVTVTVMDVATGTVDLTQSFTTTSALCKGYDTPSTIELGAITKGLKTIRFDFSISSGYVCNYKNVNFTVEPAADPSTIFTFGTTRDEEDGQITSNNYMLTPACSDVTTSDLISTYGTLGTTYSFYKGSETPLTFGENATQSFRNATSSTTIKTQAGDADGAENHDAYIAFDLTIASGKMMQIREIASVLYPAEKNNYYYEFIVEDKDGNQIYKSPSPLQISSAKSPNDYIDYHANVASVASLMSLTGTVRVKFLWWCNSSSTVVILKDFNVKASVVDVPATYYSIYYDLGTETEAVGTLPASVTDQSTAETYTIPANKTLYKEGYSLKGWTDGENEYLIGQPYSFTEGVKVLTPVFVANTVSLAEAKNDVTVHWEFRTNAGAPSVAVEGASKPKALLVTQAVVNGKTIDLCLNINANPGKFNNGNGDWAQVNTGTIFTFPSVAGSIVTSHVYSDPTAATTLDGNEPVYSSSIATWTAAPTSGVSTLTVQGGSYYKYLEMVVPGSAQPWDNYEDFALDLTNGAYITSAETSVITIGFKKEGENIVRCAADDEDAIGKLTGKFHSVEHGLQNFKLVVGVPGRVKISVGTCAWGGSLTVKVDGNKVAAINTNNGTCFHQNKENNKVYTYYVGEAATLTIEGGNYMPYIAIEEVNEVTISDQMTEAEWNAIPDNQQTELTINRTLVPGMYNTLCVPFDWNPASEGGFAAYFGSGCEVLELESSSLENNELVLTFKAAANNKMYRGKAYLVKPTVDVTSWTIDATIKKALNPTQTTAVDFIATYLPTELTPSENTLCVGASNTLFYVGATSTLKGLRGYFNVKGVAAGTPARISLGSHVATGVDDAQSLDPLGTGNTMHDVQKCIENGHIVIRINGCDYNLNGNRIR